MSNREDLIGWLNDARGMEFALEEVLRNHIKDADPFPDLRAGLEVHLDETRQHVRRVEQCLEILGATPSMGKGLLGDIMGRLSALSTAVYSDEIVKNMLKDYAAEHFEIACYESLIAAAEAIGEREVASLCRETLEEEESMAEWIRDMIPDITRGYLRQGAARSGA